MSLYHHSFFFTIYSRSIPQILLKLPQILLLPEYLYEFYLSCIPAILHSYVCAICHSIFLCNIYYFFCDFGPFLYIFIDTVWYKRYNQRELLGNRVTRASEIWRDTAFFQGASITPILLAIRLCSYFYYFWCF